MASSPRLSPSPPVYLNCVRLLFPFPLIPVGPIHSSSSSQQLCDQTANLWGDYFLLICRTPLLSITTCERLLLMVPSKKESTLNTSKASAGIVQVLPFWITKVQLHYNVYEIKMHPIHLAFELDEQTKQRYLLICCAMLESIISTLSQTLKLLLPFVP